MVATRSIRVEQVPTNLAIPVTVRAAALPSAARQLVVALGFPVLSGLFLSFGFPPFTSPLCAWFALVPLFFAAIQAKHVFDFVVGAYCGGLVFHLVALDWMRTSFGGAGISGVRAPAWMAIGAIGALSWPLAGCLLRIGFRSLRLPAVAMTAPAWIAVEWLRFLLGNLLAQNEFPWLQVGHTQSSSTRIAQLAEVGGVWLIGALVVLVNGAVVDTTLRRERRIRPLVGAILAILVSLAYGQARLTTVTDSPGPVVIAMNDAIDPGNKVVIEKIAHEARRGAADDHTTILVWPENSEFRASWQDADETTAERIASIAEAAHHAQAFLIVGCLRFAGQRQLNSLAWFAPDQGLIGFTDKSKLVPWSEHRPESISAFRPIGKCHLSPGALPREGILVGRRNTGEPIIAAGAVCYDVCFPQVFWTSAAGQRFPDFWVVGSSEGHDRTGALWRNTEMVAAFRCIETRRPMVRSVRGGPSVLIDSAGRVARRVEAQAIDRQLGEMRLSASASAYRLLGDFIPILCLGFWFLSGLRAAYTRVYLNTNQHVA